MEPYEARNAAPQPRRRAFRRHRRGPAGPPDQTARRAAAPGRHRRSSTTSTSTGWRPTSLVAAKVAAVVNAAAEHLRPLSEPRARDLLVSSGIALLDDVGEEVFAAGQGGHPSPGRRRHALRRRRAAWPRAPRRTPRRSRGRWPRPKAGCPSQLEAFAANTMEYMKRERDAAARRRRRARRADEIERPARA